jgi:hypothetical protein
VRLRRLLELLELCADQRFAGCAADAALPGRRGAGAGLEWESSESKIMMWNQNLTKATRCI